MYSYPSKGPIRSRLSYWTRYPYKPRFGWGLFLGWFSAAGLSLWVIGLAIANRSTYFPRYGIDLGHILLGYWIAGTTVGLLLGIAHPLIRSRLGSFILGFVLGWVVYSIAAVVPYGWDAQYLLFALIPGLLVGGGLGVVFYDKEHPAHTRG